MAQDINKTERYLRTYKNIIDCSSVFINWQHSISFYIINVQVQLNS